MKTPEESYYWWEQVQITEDRLFGRRRPPTPVELKKFKEDLNQLLVRTAPSAKTPAGEAEVLNTELTPD